MKTSRFLKYIMDVEINVVFLEFFWSFFEGISHNPDKIAHFLGYLAYLDKNDKNRQKINPDIGSIIVRHTS